MAKKVAIILLSVLLLLLVILGLYFIFADKSDVDEVVPTESTTVVEDEYLDEDMGVEEYITDETENTTSETEGESFVPSDDQLSDNTDDIISTIFSIARVVDHTTNEEVHPRVVFGSGYNAEDNYIKFDTSGNFEMYLSGFFNNTKTGTYTQFDDIIYVEYTDSTAAEYDIKYDESGVISYIIVNYGDYDIYFA